MEPPIATETASEGIDPPRHHTRQSLYEAHYTLLRGKIADNTIPEGTVLLEGPLADIFGSSRAPVRQALRKLADEGLISRFEGRGFITGSAEAIPTRLDLGKVLGDLCETAPRPVLTWQTLYEAVERPVVLHSFLGRYRINEVELARQHGVGRGVAHDVLVRLESLGLIEKDERSRWATVPLDDRRIADLYEIRKHLEPVAIADAMQQLQPGTVEQMMARLKDALECYPDTPSSLLYDLELDLHVRCLDACSNREMVTVLKRTRSVLTLSKHVLGFQGELPENEPFMQEHLAILRLVGQQDRDGAMDAMRQHIHASESKVRKRAAAVRQSFQPAPCGFIS